MICSMYRDFSMVIETLSTFPHMFDSVMGSSMMQRAQDKGIFNFCAYDLRNWTHDKHRTTDDDPYGGGNGLIMKCEPIFEAVEDILGIRIADATAIDHPLVNNAKVIFLAPCGRQMSDSLAAELSTCDRLLFVCGHYEGIDERAYALADEIISLGDYVLTGGELASMVVIDALVRKIDGVLGAQDGAEEESFTNGLLEYPQYTRPADFRGALVPDILISGDHGAVDRWRHEQSLTRTAKMRPDLLEVLNYNGDLNSADRKFLESLGDEQGYLF